MYVLHWSPYVRNKYSIFWGSKHWRMCLTSKAQQVHTKYNPADWTRYFARLLSRWTTLEHVWKPREGLPTFTSGVCWRLLLIIDWLKKKNSKSLKLRLHLEFTYFEGNSWCIYYLGKPAKFNFYHKRRVNCELLDFPGFFCEWKKSRSCIIIMCPLWWE